MIDVHTHVFDFNTIPFTKNSFVTPERIRILSGWLQKLSAPGNTGALSQWARFLRIGHKKPGEIFRYMADFYPDKTQFVVLMWDFSYGMPGRAATGFNEQLQQIIALKEAFPDTVIPFLAVDPRRKKIEELVTDMVGKDKHFTGLKLCPQMGFLPGDPVLMRIFARCEAEKIPVTTHCSLYTPAARPGKIRVRGLDYHNGNVIKADTLKRFYHFNQYCAYFTAPEKWIPVLEQFPGLYVNIAHFGGSDAFMQYIKGKKNTWADTIIRLMSKYENVYTDISNINAIKKIYPALKKILQSNVGCKILFGSDSYHVLLKGKLDKILGYCKTELTPDEVRKITVDNPKAFLNI